MGGRSTGSKNRIYQEIPDLNGNANYLKTAIYNTSGDTGNATATLYVAQRSREGWHVASNGEQTDGISTALAVAPAGEWLEYFQRGQRLYRDEGPQNAYTPRITAAASADHPTEVFMGQIIRDPEQGDDVYRAHSLVRDFELKAGEAYMLTTYDGKGGTDANRDNPWGFRLEGSMQGDMDKIWEQWDPETKGNLAGKEVNMKTGEVTYLLRSIHTELPTLPKS